jgi:hypothetical protein
MSEAIKNEIWASVYRLKAALHKQRGRRIHLSHTYRQLAIASPVDCVAKWVMTSGGTLGFTMLWELGMLDNSAEAIVLRHPEEFDAVVVATARRRLIQAGVSL